MKNICIASLEAGEGKTTAAVAIALNKKAAYMKPLGDNPSYTGKKVIDYDALLFSKLLGIKEEMISLGMIHSKIIHNYKDAIKEVRRRYEEMMDGKDIFIFEGGENIWKGSSLGLDMKNICKEFDATPVFIVTGEENEIKDKIKFVSSFGGYVILNKTKEYQYAKEYTEENGLKFGGYIPEIKKLRMTKVSYIVEKLNGKIVAGSEGIENYFDGVFIAALSASQIKRHPDFKKKNKLIITGGDRSDAIAACIDENTSAIILTNNIIPSSNILAKADKEGIPLISVRPDTYTIASRIEKLPRPILADEKEKIDEIKKKAMVEI